MSRVTVTIFIVGVLNASMPYWLCLNAPLFPKKYKEDLTYITDILTPKYHYRSYKEHINTTLSELFFIEETHKTCVDEPQSWGVIFYQDDIL